MHPKVLAKQQLEELAAEVQGQLHLVKKHKEETWHRLQDLRLQLQEVQKRLEGQVLQLHKAESMEREAFHAVVRVERHVRDWRAAAQVTQ